MKAVPRSVLTTTASQRCSKPCAAGLPRRRADRARPGDRLRRYRRARGPAAGWTDEQDGGHYRLHRRDDDALFGYAVGPHSWKKFLLPPVQRSVARRAQRRRALRIVPEPASTRFAFIGVRACELHAIAIQDRVFLEGAYVDPHYRARREGAFIVAVNCAEPAAPASASRWTPARRRERLRPRADRDRRPRRAPVRCRGGQRGGRTVLAELPHRAATPEEVAAAEPSSPTPPPRWAAHAGRDEVRELLLRNLEHPRWDDVAGRCLACGNCTMVCPTCFCTTVEDSSDLDGRRERALAALGFLLHDGFLLHPRRQRAHFAALALPPMDDPQARHLDRSVRHLRLRRLRPLHHLVPGRHRHHRGGRGHPRPKPSGREERHACEGLGRLIARASVLRRHGDERIRPRGGCARNVRFEAGSTCSARASRPTSST